MRIRIVTFGLNIPAEPTPHTPCTSPRFIAWPCRPQVVAVRHRLRRFGGVYLFASQHDAYRSRETDLFRACSLTRR